MKSMFFENRDITKAYRTMNESYEGEVETDSFETDSAEMADSDLKKALAKVLDIVARHDARIVGDVDECDGYAVVRFAVNDRDRTPGVGFNMNRIMGVGYCIEREMRECGIDGFVGGGYQGNRSSILINMKHPLTDSFNESYDDMETADYGREEYAADDKDISKGDTYSDIIGTISELKSEDKDVFIYQVIKEIARRISKGESDGAAERSLVVRDGCSSLPEVEGAIEDGIERLRGLEKVSESDTDYENEFTAMSDNELERAHLNAIRTRSVDLEAIRDEIARREADKKAEF